MELRVLGPLEVRHDGVVVPFSRVRPRELLALLALRANAATSAERLIEELWDGAAPSSAASALRVHLSLIRRVLDGGTREKSGEKRLVLEPGGYCLHVDVNELDVLAFEHSASRGSDAYARGDPEHADQLLSTALRSWRGPAFAEIRHLTAAHGAVARIDELRAQVVEVLADVRTSTGAYEGAIELLLAAIGEWPFRERLTAQLMVALYRTGRQADALRAYAELARALDEQLGLKPSDDLRALEEDMLLQRRHLRPYHRALEQRTECSAPQTTIRLIGRRAELARLIELHDEAIENARRFALISGPSGIGKTVLVDEYVARARRAGHVVVVTKCAPSSESYEPVIQLLSGLGAPSVVHALVAGDSSIDGSAAISADTDDSSAASLRLLEAIGTAVTAAARPTVSWIIEDLQWADLGTLRAVRRLLRTDAVRGLLVVATYTDDEADNSRRESIARLAPPAQTVPLVLRGLDVHEIRALVRAVSDPITTPVLLDLSSVLERTTDGNPLVLAELVREVARLDIARFGRSELERFIERLAPRGVQAIVERRLQRLSPDALEVLQAASVVGTAIPTELLSDVTTRTQAQVREALEEALQAGLLYEHDWHVDLHDFVHNAIRNAVYQRIESDVCKQLHARVADALAAHARSGEDSIAGRMAYHRWAAMPFIDSGEVSAAARRAGDDAARRLDFGEACAWYERALALSGDTDPCTTAELKLALGRAYEADHRYADARPMFVSGAREALNACSPSLAVDLAIAASGPWSSGFDNGLVESRALLNAALQEIENVDVERQVQLLSTGARALYHVDPDEQRRQADQAYLLASTSNSPTALCNALLARHLSVTHTPESRSERLALANAALEQAVTAESVIHQLRAQRELLTDLLENVEPARFDLVLARYEQLAGTTCSPHDIYWSMVLRATQATLRGDLIAGEQLARGARLRGQELDQESSGAEFLQRFIIRFQQGRLAEEAPIIRAMKPESSAYRAGNGLAALAVAETGHAAKACGIVQRTLLDAGGLPKDAFWLGAHAMFASAAAAFGDRELMHALVDVLEPCQDHVIVFGAGGAVLGSGHHWLGELRLAECCWDLAAAHLRTAIEVSERLDAPYWRAQAQLDLATALARRAAPRPSATSERLRAEATATAEKNGYGRLIVRAAAAS